jgi:hypothetical protein
VVNIAVVENYAEDKIRTKMSFRADFGCKALGRKFPAETAHDLVKMKKKIFLVVQNLFLYQLTRGQ